MKSNQMVEPTIAEDFSSVSFVVRGKDTLTLDMGKLHADILKRAACVGMAQVRIVDAAAIARADKSGKVRTAAEMVDLKWERMAALIAHYETGTAEWSRIREASGVAGGFLFEALCEMYEGKQTPAQVREFLDGLSNAEQAALREDDEVEPIIARIKAKRNEGKPVVDTKSILGKLQLGAAIDVALTE